MRRRIAMKLSGISTTQGYAGEHSPVVARDRLRHTILISSSSFKKGGSKGFQREGGEEGGAQGGLLEGGFQREVSKGGGLRGCFEGGGGGESFVSGGEGDLPRVPF